MKNKTTQLAYAGVIAAVYATLTMVLTYSTSYGLTQFRIAEGLTVLPYFSAYSIAGIFIGCVISNLISPVGPLDIIVGSLATLIAAVATYYIGRSNLKYKKLLAPLPPVVINALMVGYMLSFTLHYPLFLSMFQVGLGQLVCCYGFGLPIIEFIERNKVLKSYFNKIK